MLWKDTQIQQDHDKDTANSWKLYQKWCKMDTHTRDCWITAGKTIQTFTKINNTKMQEVPRQQGNITTEGKFILNFLQKKYVNFSLTLILSRKCSNTQEILK